MKSQPRRRGRGRSAGSDERVDGNGREEQREVGVREGEQSHGALRVASRSRPKACHTNAAPSPTAATRYTRPIVSKRKSVSVTATTTSVYTRICRAALATPLRDRQHRDPRRRVVVAVLERQRPEVRRRPAEHDGEQHPRGRGERAGDRRPADEDRHGAGRAADHDVLRAARLEPDRVHEDVEEHRAHRQRRCEQVHRAPRATGTRSLQGEAEHERMARARSARRGADGRWVRCMT